MLTEIIYGTFQIIELWWKLKHEKCTLGSTFTMYSNFHVKYMHFIKCNRIIIFYDPDLDTCALSAVRGDGSSPVWLLVAKLRSSWIHHLISLLRGAGWKQAIRAWTRWCRRRRQASVTSSCVMGVASGRMGASREQRRTHACLLCFAGKQRKPAQPVLSAIFWMFLNSSPNLIFCKTCSRIGSKFQ